jgi:hypothetical protein
MTSGNVVVAFASFLTAATTIDSISSSCVSGGFTLVLNPSGTAYKSAIGYGVLTSSGSCTVTATVSASAGLLFTVVELSGRNTSSPVGSNEYAISEASGSPSTTSSITTATNGSDVVAFASDPDGNSTSWGADTGNGWTLDLNDTTNDAAVQSKNQATAGAITAAFTVAPTWNARALGIIAVKPAETPAASRKRIVIIQ